MIAHSQVKRNLANAIVASDDVKNFCVEKFGRAALVIVDWFGAEVNPGVKEAPFVFLYSADENEAGFVDEETFQLHVVVGGVAGGEFPNKSVVRVRTASQNGLIVNGVASVLEELRGKIETIIKAGGLGATARTFRRIESSTADFPLEWAKLSIDFYEPETL